MKAAAVAPVKGSFTELKTGETISFLINPKEFSEKVQVNYNRLQVLGLSHQILQYQGTGNVGIPLEFYLDRTIAADLNPKSPDILKFKRFLQALTVPPQGDSAPPRVLFVWPKLISLTCVVTSLEFKYLQFFHDGSPLRYTASVTLEEISVVRMYSETLYGLGSQRGGK